MKLYEAMSNLTSGISINYKYDVEKTFAENAVQVHKRITRKLKRYKVFVLQFLARLPMTLIDAVLLNTYNLAVNTWRKKPLKS